MLADVIYRPYVLADVIYWPYVLVDIILALCVG